MLGQAVSPVAVNNQTPPPTGGVFNSPSLSQFLTNQPQSTESLPPEQPEKDLYQKNPQNENLDKTQKPIIDKKPSTKQQPPNYSMEKLKQAAIVLGIGAAGTAAFFFGRKHFEVKPVETLDQLKKYAEDVVQSHEEPDIKKLNVSFDNLTEDQKKDALKAFIKISKHWSNTSFEKEYPVFHLVLKEASRGNEGLIRDRLNQTGDLSDLVHHIEKLNLSSESTGFLERYLFNKRCPVKMNIGSYCFYNSRDAWYVQMKERFLKLF